MADSQRDPDVSSGARPFEELSGAGLLWLINKVVFHPRGFALTLHQQTDGAVTGWSIQGDGAEPWEFTDQAKSDAHFAAVEATLQRAREDNAETEQTRRAGP